MPASRWNSLNYLPWWNKNDWPEEDLNNLEEWMLSLAVPPAPISKSTDESSGDQPQVEGHPSQIPAVLPILPLRGLVVYPETAVPLTIGQSRSIRLVDDVLTQDNRLIGLVTSKDPDLEIPEPKDLYQVGTVAMVHRLFRAPDGTIRLLVQGLARFRVGEFVSTEPYLKARIELAPELVLVAGDVFHTIRPSNAAIADAFRQFARLAAALPDSAIVVIAGNHDHPKRLGALASLLEGAVAWADVCHSSKVGWCVSVWHAPHT